MVAFIGTIMKLTPQIKSLVQELSNLQSQLAEDPASKPVLSPPATREEIEGLEKRLNISLPPSYRTFLELHNGWKNFGVLRLFGTEDHGSQWAHKQQSFYEDVDQGQPFKVGAIPFVMGEAKDGINHFWAFDPNNRGADNEMEVVDWDYGHEESRCGNFVEFLRKRINVAQQLIKRHGAAH